MNRKCYRALRRSVQPVERRFVSVDLNAMYDDKNYNNNNHIKYNILLLYIFEQFFFFTLLCFLLFCVYCFVFFF